MQSWCGKEMQMESKPSQRAAAPVAGKGAGICPFFTLNPALLVLRKGNLLPCPPPDTSARLSRSRHYSVLSFQSDLIYQSVYELIHADDRAVFHRQLHRTPVHAADSECQGDPCRGSLEQL